MFRGPAVVIFGNSLSARKVVLSTCKVRIGDYIVGCSFGVVIIIVVEKGPVFV